MIITEFPDEPNCNVIHGSEVKQQGDPKGARVLDHLQSTREKRKQKKELHELKPVFSLKERLHETKKMGKMGKTKQVHETMSVHMEDKEKGVHETKKTRVQKRLQQNSGHRIPTSVYPTILTKHEGSEEHVIAHDNVKYTMDSCVGDYYKMKIFNPVTNRTHYELVTNNQLSDIVNKSSAYDAMGGVVQVIGRVMKKKVLVLLEKTGSTPVINPYFSTVLTEMSWIESGTLEINLGSSVSDIPEILELAITGFKKDDKNSLLICFTASVWEPVGKTLKKETYFTEASFASLKWVYSRHKSKRLKKILTEYALASDARNKIYSTEYSSWWIDPGHMDKMVY